MDIEPLWALGGWFIFPDNCMAAAPKTPASVSETYTKFHPFLFLLAFFFIFLLLLRPTQELKPSMVSSSISIKRVLLESSGSVSTSTTNMNPKKQTQHSAAGGREFEAGAHEVPSGPNPISN